MDKEQIEMINQKLDMIEDNEITINLLYHKCNLQEDYIHHLETKNKELSKGQQSLMQSRRKWKARYYKERRKVKDLEEDRIKSFIENRKCDEYNEAEMYKEGNDIEASVLAHKKEC